jgi:hypothetical protein
LTRVAAGERVGPSSPVGPRVRGTWHLTAMARGEGRGKRSASIAAGRLPRAVAVNQGIGTIGGPALQAWGLKGHQPGSSPAHVQDVLRAQQAAREHLHGQVDEPDHPRPVRDAEGVHPAQRHLRVPLHPPRTRCPRNEGIAQRDLIPPGDPSRISAADRRRLPGVSERPRACARVKGSRGPHAYWSVTRWSTIASSIPNSASPAAVAWIVHRL